MTGAEAPREDPTVERSAESLRDVELGDLASVHGGDDGRDVWESRTYVNERNPGGPSLPLIVRVRHCSLEHAPYRLLVGHFQGLPLSGAESRLNERSEGRLERLLLMNQYPQRLGETVVLEPVDEAPPLGMVIIGLGPSGELSAAGLRSAITRALVRVALNELDRRLATDAGATESLWRPLGISSVLIGSSAGGGLPVEASVRALIDAVTTANARLARLRVFSGTGEVDATDVVRFDVLELTERYEDRVDLIVGVLARMQQLENQDAAASDGSVPRVTYVLAAEPGEGASSANPPIDAADEVWRRIDIRARQGASSSVTQLEFTSIGRLARAERLLVDVERTIVDPLLAEAIDRHADPHISGTLYELLIPHELKGELGSAENLHLLVDEATADWPLELLRPRADEEDRRIPMALRVGVLRQFRETEGLRYNVRRASSNNALVIGNPPTPGAADLPGAAEECLAAAEVLAKHNFDVDSLIWKTDGTFVGDRAPGSTGTSPLDALHALLNGDWRVLHIAAHGVFTDDSTTTGVLLGGLRLTANTFSKMSVVPDLVLLNACHLGRIGASPSLAGANRTAASIGRALLALGVRAVAVAGWAVDDDAAKEFAARLIEGLAEGEDFGAAVTVARQEAWRKAPHSLTWGAYQCYGDPGFSLAPRPRRPGGEVHTVGELRRRTRRLASTASDQGRSASSNTIARRDEIRDQLEKLEQRAGELRADRGVRRPRRGVGRPPRFRPRHPPLSIDAGAGRLQHPGEGHRAAGQPAQPSRPTSRAGGNRPRRHRRPGGGGQVAAARTRPRPQRRAAGAHGRVPQAHRGDDDRR